MIFNVVNGGGQTYDNSDAIKYPVSNIPQGAEKVYTEQYISDIGDMLNLVLYNTTPVPMPRGGMDIIDLDIRFSECTIT